MAEGWFHTGDVARMDDDGYLLIADRLKDQINTADSKVWPREVEEAGLCLGLKATSITRLMPAVHPQP
jgi:acyl-CoA synthetase (AMP-forming)/AMP-acid ligase II